MPRAARLLVRAAHLAGGNLGDADGVVHQVTCDILRAKDFRLAAQCAAAQAVHLPQAILGHGVAQAKVDVCRGARISK